MEAERRAEEAEKLRSEAESQGGDQEEDDTNARRPPPEEQVGKDLREVEGPGAEHQISGAVVLEEGRVKLPSDDAQGTEQTASPTVRSMAVAGAAEAGL